MSINAKLRAEIDAKVAAGEVTRVPASKRGRRQCDAVASRRAKVAQMHSQGSNAKIIAEQIDISVATIYADLRQLGLTKPRRPQSDACKATVKKQRRAQDGARHVADRRRFKVMPVPFGQPSVLADADATGPLFPSRVFTSDGNETVFKDGCNNSKIGGDVLVGRLKGAYIATLTLPERTTCPRSCAMWRGCYGNTMQHARRWAPGPELEAQMDDELGDMCIQNDNVLIRLHVLGDFYSFEYLTLWAKWLDLHDNLHVFGFTAWQPSTEIGDGIARLRSVYPDRFMIRHSGTTGTWGSFTLPFPTDRKTVGDAIVCPEQLDAMTGSKDGRHCGNCAVCWSTDKPIAFVEH